MAASLPFIAFGYKFGLLKSLLIFTVVLVAVLLAKLAIYLFTRRSKVAKGAANLLQNNLIFLLFMPRQIKAKMQELKDKEHQSGFK